MKALVFQTATVKTPRGRVSLLKHAARIAQATGCHVIKRRVPNPTLVAHGLVKASRWHVLTHEPPRQAVADLYVGDQGEAAKVVRVLANLLGAELDLLDNRATPADLKAHARHVVVPRMAMANGRRRPNPKGLVHRIVGAIKHHVGRHGSSSITGTRWLYVTLDNAGKQTTVGELWHGLTETEAKKVQRVLAKAIGKPITIGRTAVKMNPKHAKRTPAGGSSYRRKARGRSRAAGVRRVSGPRANPKGRKACGSIGRAYHDCLHGRKTGCRCANPPRARGAARAFADQLIENAENYHHDRISSAVHSRINRSIWDAIEGLGPRIKSQVDGFLRQYHAAPRKNPRRAVGQSPVTRRHIKARGPTSHRGRNPKGHLPPHTITKHGREVVLHVWGLDYPFKSRKIALDWLKGVQHGIDSGYLDPPRGIAHQIRRTANRRRPVSRRSSPPAGSRRARSRSNPGARTPAARAASTVRMFQDRGPVRLHTKRMKAPAALKGAAAELGKLEAVVYTTNKFDGKSRDYEHVFDDPKPSLVSDPDGQGLHIVGGKYGITPDGIIH